MESLNVTELRKIAKERNLREYSRMNKEALVNAVVNFNKTNFLDEPIIDLTTPISKPAEYKPVKKEPKVIFKKVKGFESFAEWVSDHIPEKI